MSKSQEYLNPETLSAISGLDYKARLMVEGFLSGAHRSPYRGFSVEFAQHREYVPGDDLRHLDWKVWGRSDRLYIKQYDAETNFECYLVVDSSGSMGFSTTSMSKLEYAKHAAAAIAHLIVGQRDAVGLSIFGGSNVSLTPSSSRSKMKELIHHLEVAEPGGDSNIGNTILKLNETSGRRRVFVILSDFLDDTETLIQSFRLLHRRKHDVLLVHLLDPAEASFPFNDYTTFLGLEGEEQLRIQPGRLRAVYLDEMKKQVSLVRNSARELQMDYLPILTNKPLGEILSAYLVSRRSRR